MPAVHDKEDKENVWPHRSHKIKVQPKRYRGKLRFEKEILGCRWIEQAGVFKLKHKSLKWWPSEQTHQKVNYESRLERTKSRSRPENEENSRSEVSKSAPAVRPKARLLQLLESQGWQQSPKFLNSATSLKATKTKASASYFLLISGPVRTILAANW